MHGVIGLLPSSEMAPRRPTSGRRNLKVVVVIDVARGTGHVGMAVRQRKSCGGVVKNGVIPTGGVVALRAICGGEGNAGL